MLQQTTVAAVAPRFERFVARWPTIEALAAASDEDILARMGRARLLRPGAQPHRLRPRGCRAAAGFRRPRQSCAQLPGLGAYTSAAIAAIAFGEKAAAVDTNVERVIARLNALKQPSRARDRAPGAGDDARRPARRFRPGDDGSRRDCLPAAQARAAASARSRADCAAFASGTPELSRRRKAAPSGRIAMASLTGSNATAGSGSCAARPRACSAAWRRCPGADWSRCRQRRARRIGTVRHVFTHFSLDLTLVRAPSRRAKAGGIRSTSSTKRPADALPARRRAGAQR